MSDGSPRPVAVVLDGPATPAWQARALRALRDSPAVELVEVRTLSGPRRGLLRRLHAAVERRLLGLGVDALAPVSLTRSDLAGGGSGSPSLVVWLSERPVQPAQSADVLYVRHEQLAEPAEEAFRRALLRDTGVVHSEVLLAGHAGTVLVERTVSGVRPFSLALSLDLMLWKLAALLPRAAERAPGLNLPAAATAPPVAAPSTVALLGQAITSWARVLRTRLLFSRPWSVRVRRRAPAPTEGWSTVEDLVRFQPGHLYADPLLIEHEGRHHLFCEEVLPG